jgi:hypothetical protein
MRRARWTEFGILAAALLLGSPALANRSSAGAKSGAVSGKSSASSKAFGKRRGVGKVLGSAAVSNAASKAPARSSRATAATPGLGSQASAGSAAATSQPPTIAPVTKPARKLLGSAAVSSKSQPLKMLDASAAPITTGYRAKVTTRNPTAVLILADHSGSMVWKSKSGDKMRSEVLANAVNGILEDLVVANLQGGEIRERLDVGVLSATDRSTRPLLPGPKGDQDLVPLSYLADNTIPGEVNGDPKPVWLRPAARGDNGDVQAFLRARVVLLKWTAEHPDSFPPTLINITDGYASDGDPTPVALDIRDNVGTKDGKTLLYNVHIGEGPSILFPDSEAELPNAEAVALFRMSRPLPPALIAAARARGIKLSDGARAFAYNADLPMLTDFLSVGSSVAM